MNAAMKNEQNPVRKILDANLKDYPAWFLRHRDIRNQIKEGRSTGSQGALVQEDGTVTPTRVALHVAASEGTAIRA